MSGRRRRFPTGGFSMSSSNDQLDTQNSSDAVPADIPNAPADPLLTPLRFVPGVGPARAALLERLSLRTVGDVLFCMPRDVLDLTDVRDPSEVEGGLLQSVQGTVVDVDSRQLRRGGSLVGVLIRSGSGFVRGVWFNQPWMFRKFQHEQVVLFSGKPKRNSGRWEFNSPHVQWLDMDDSDLGRVRVLPRYGLTEGLRMHEMRRIARDAVDAFVEFVPERIPDRWLDAWKLMGIREALRQLHQPESVDDWNGARRRLLFEDLFEFQIAVALRRRAWRISDQAPVLKTTSKIDSRIRRLFPFQFTAGQDAAVKDIAADLASGRAMHRLLQADVGAGKTAIAIYAMLVAVAAEHQAVLMAPTELLATQHWHTIDRALSQSRVNRCLLTGSLTAAQRRSALERIASGELQLVVGTQALIQKDVEFARLGLAVIDEQHKFGVGQRARFSLGENQPHVLVMTATPIPRSLCLTQFGDLDLTVINELPPGRQPVKSWRVHNPATRQKAWSFIRERLNEGRQVFVVCPRVRQTTKGDEPEFEDPFADCRPEELAGSTEEVFEQLRQGELKGFSIGLVHGQMDAQQKADAMEAFRTGETQALVSTTVIEVGVDVPNASMIVIQQAERFGLSQLHQLRGRIGRGQHQGYCFLFSDATDAAVTQRLNAMENHADGFEIAEVDFELRGPGDILGTRQHGALPLRFASLVRDRDLLEEAREAAFKLVGSGEFDEAAFAPLKIEVLERFGELMNLPRSG